MPETTDAAKQAALDAYWGARTPQEERAAVDCMKLLGMWKKDEPWHNDAQALLIAREANDQLREIVLQQRTLLTAWLMSGAMAGEDLDKLKFDTEEALRD